MTVVVNIVLFKEQIDGTLSIILELKNVSFYKTYKDATTTTTTTTTNLISTQSQIKLEKNPIKKYSNKMNNNNNLNETIFSKFILKSL
jgi:hypothetical protein